MAINWECYIGYLKHFLTISSSFEDGWIMKKMSNSTDSPENCYLFKRVNCQIPLSISNCPSRDDSSDIPRLQDDSNVQSETIIWEYHIIYSPSYSVPVLYFNVRYPSGKTLTLEHVWNILNVNETVLTEKWSFVSQQEHPILLQPFFYLHPCKSYEIFTLAKDSNVNPIITWLSSIAPIVHLKIPLGFGKHIQQLK